MKDRPGVLDIVVEAKHFLFIGLLIGLLRGLLIDSLFARALIFGRDGLRPGIVNRRYGMR